MKKLRTAVYARHSAILQNLDLVSDQAAVCQQQIEREGGLLVSMFSDPETPGYPQDRLEKATS